MFTSPLFALLPILPLVFAAPATPHLTGVEIVSRRSGLCLIANNGKGGAVNLTPITLAKCSTTPVHQKVWNIATGIAGSITLAGQPDMAIDVGETSGNGGAVKTWVSYPGIEQQTWFYTADNHLAIAGGDQCLDETNGNKLQTYLCIGRNPNQLFDLKPVA